MIATLNLNGDYISDALAAQVSGMGPRTGSQPVRFRGLFRGDPRHRAKYAGKDYVNPGSGILSAMMLRHMGWTEAADRIINSMEQSILSKKVT